MVLVVPLARSEDLPPCSQRPDQRGMPFINNHLWCLEQVTVDHNHGEFAFTALVTAPDGTLYATRPEHGEILALRDTDDDLKPDSPQIIAEDLTQPNALVYHDGSLYIAGGPHIYRLDLTVQNAVTILVDDLPAGTGPWTGGLIIHENRLYVGTGAACDFCITDDPEAGAILSFALDGSDRQLVAQGLRYPAGLAFYRGDLWITDTGPHQRLDVPWLDELNRMSLDDAPVHFGFPYCEGADNTSTPLNTDFDCDRALAPQFSFATYSSPAAILPYEGETYADFLEDELLIVLSGSFQRSDIRGYQIINMAIPPETQPDDPVWMMSVMPFETQFFNYSREPTVYSPPGYRDEPMSNLNRRGGGLWPHRLYDVALSPEGWIYLSAGGGEIMVLRPGDFEPCDFTAC